MKIYILIEVAKRELDSKIYLALMLTKLGFEVAIAKKSRLYEKLDLIDPGIIFFKSFGPKYENIIKKIRQNNHEVTGIDEEGLQFRSKELLIGKLRFSKEVVKDSKVIYCWGDKSKKIYKNFIKNKNLNIIKSGNPRIDLIKETNKIYKVQAEKLKIRFGKFILIPTQFLQANPSAKEIANVKNPNVSYTADVSVSEKEISNFVNVKIKKLERDKNYQKKSFQFYDKLYSFLNKNHSNRLFIVRPHPGENLEYYKKLDKKYSNIKVTFESTPINPWILASELVISNNCTTAIEAFFIKGGSINYIPYKDLKSEYFLNKNISLEIRKLKQLSKVLNNNLVYKKKITKKNVKILKSFIENYNSINSSKVIGKSLKKFYKENIFKKEKENYIKRYFYYLLYFLKSKIFGFLNFIFQSKNPDYLSQKNKRIDLNQNAIKEKVSIISKLKIFKGNYKVLEKHYGIYLIKKAN